MVALCAAKSKARKNDIYLDDYAHTALGQKFYTDFYEMGFIKFAQDTEQVEPIVSEKNKIYTVV